MLTKCMLPPLKLARMLEWNASLGKTGAIMAIDVTNHQIGVALAHHSQEESPPSLSLPNTITTTSTIANNAKDFEYVQSIYTNREFNSGSSSLFGTPPTTTTTLTPLPPIPYMSHRPYHASYTSRHSHRLTVAGLPNKPPRFHRTLEIAGILRDIANQYGVSGILVRWPGGGSSGSNTNGMMTGRAVGFEEELVREMEEGRLLLLGQHREDSGDEQCGDESNHLLGETSATNAGVGTTTFRRYNYGEEEGTMGYRRGRVLYFLDKCCMQHNNNNNNKSNKDGNKTQSTLLSESSRPFAFWDSTFSEHNWMMARIMSDPESNQQHQHHHHAHHGHPHPHFSAPLERVDKYGNSLTSVDQWGRAPIFGMPPEDLLLRFQKHREDHQLQQQQVQNGNHSQDHRGSFYYSSKHQFAGYHDSEEEKMMRDEGRQRRLNQFRGSGNHYHPKGNDGEREVTTLEQLEGSLSAAYALHEFARMHLQSRILLPSWMMDTMISRQQNNNNNTKSTQTMNSSNLDNSEEEESDEEYELFGEKHDEKDYRREVPMGYRRTRLPFASAAASSSSPSSPANDERKEGSTTTRAQKSYDPPKKEKTNGLVSLVGVPVRKIRRRGRSERPSLV